MAEQYLAFDLGAESGRAVLGELGEDGLLTTRELHRFPNAMVPASGHLHWDLPGLYREMLLAMGQAAQRGQKLSGIGVDTWGVDFGLFDARGDLIGAPFTYRDPRTRGAMEEFLKVLPWEKLYALTGIQLLPINTLFQLYALVRDHSPQLDAARDLLFIPDIFHYWLTGIKRTEFTFATTSQLFNPGTGTWEKEIFDRMGVPQRLMQEVVSPGTVLGELTEEVKAQTGLKGTPVLAVGTHDTASAVAALPATQKGFAYISCGTWSLVGIESPEPIINETTRGHNLTNEGGVAGTFRVLKNLSGLWLLQECRRRWTQGREYSYAELVGMAEGALPFRSIIDPDHPMFLSPPDMPLAMAEFCAETGQPAPPDTAAFVRAILESLALAYRHALELLREISREEIEVLYLVGGGSQNRLLCQFTADATGLPVSAGPAEATAVGNLLVQAMARGRIGTLAELRKVVRASFPQFLYEPRSTDVWEKPYQRFLSLKRRTME